jgi:hypothetical protein
VVDARLLAALTEAVEKMRGDVSLTKVGKIKCLSHGADVTEEILGRVEERLATFEAILAQYRSA